MTAPIVERVARAISRVYFAALLDDSKVDEAVDAHWSFWIPEARASIREMHTMVEEVITALEPLAVYGRPDSRDVDTAKTIESIASLRALLKDAP